MTRWPILPIFAALASLCQAQDSSSQLKDILGFEGLPTATGIPEGWDGDPPGTIFSDDRVVHVGRRSARIDRRAFSPSSASSLSMNLPIDFIGKTLELRGFLRTEAVSLFARLFMREDGPSGPLAFGDMQLNPVKGTTGWTEYTVVLPLRPGATGVLFGILAAGPGTTWCDDLQLLVDGKPVWEAPKIETLPASAQAGENALKELTAIQIENLATLGKVWGFLKYHHPKVTSGQRNWDDDLFHVLPAILNAADPEAADRALLRWIDDLGAVAPCGADCARLAENHLYLRPDLRWLNDEAMLGRQLSQKLLTIYDRRLAGRQYYVSLAPVVKNPSFDHELAYDAMKAPDAKYQILALFRFWNIIEYWFPNRDVLGEDWDAVLKRFIPKIVLARTPDGYNRELMALIASAHDSHANLWSALRVRPPQGACQLPATVRFIENQAVVTGPAGGEPGELKIGDVITDLDDVAVPKLVETWTPYYAASNEPARLRDIARNLTRGPCGGSKVRVQRGSATLALTAERRTIGKSSSAVETHDLPGDTIRLLSSEVAYLKLSTVKAAETPHYAEMISKTKGLIIDLRNYPSEFVVFALGSWLVDKKTEFVRFTNGDLSNPGAFYWTEPLSLIPQKPHYSGKVVILVDEVTQSQAEYTAMAFRASPNAVVMGSTTAGADGNVSQIVLPGGGRSAISGIGVFYPDQRPTQRVGIIPDVEAHPTLEGIRAGRDEVLEAAVRKLQPVE